MLTSEIQQSAQQPFGVHLDPTSVLIVVPQHDSNAHERRSPESPAG
jgi:hypothetical protein